MFHVVFRILSLVICKLGGLITSDGDGRDLYALLLITRNYVVSLERFLLPLGVKGRLC